MGEAKRTLVCTRQGRVDARIYSIFDLKYFLKMTGASASIENAQSITIEVQEKLIVELVILYSVFPASMAMNDGGATLKILFLKYAMKK